MFPKMYTNCLFTDSDIVLLHGVVSKSAGFTETFKGMNKKVRQNKLYKFMFKD